MRACVLVGLLIGACVLVAACLALLAGAVLDPRVRERARALMARAAGGVQDIRGGLPARLAQIKGHAAPGLRGLGDRRRAERRRAACMDELPELIDVVALGLSAGISFDAALEMYCDRYHTMLAGLLGDALRSWQLGFATRAEALSQLARDLDCDAFGTFVNTIDESLAFGAPLARVLVEQGEAVRERRRSELEEQIEKAPVKMIVPVGTLVLPAMLLAIVGPLFASYLSGA